MPPSQQPRRKAKATPSTNKGARSKPAPKRKSTSAAPANSRATDPADPNPMPPLVSTVVPVQNNNDNNGEDNAASLFPPCLGPNGSPTGGVVTTNGNNVSPGSYHSDLTMKSAVNELHEKDQAGHLKWNESDMISLCRNQTNNSIWNICKTPNFSSTGNKLMERMIHAYMKRELDIPEADYERSWPVYKGVVTEALRTKRSTASQACKQKFFGE